MLQVYARNKLVWPLSVGFSFITWILNGWFGLGGKMAHTVLLTPFFDYAVGMLVCVAAIYLLAEINTRYAFLSNSDRTISMTFMLLIAMAMFIHPLQTSHLVMICYLIGYFLLFDTYQSRQTPLMAFSVSLTLGVSSLVCPQILWLLIANIISLIILRAFGMRALVASFLGVILPYWFWGIISYAFFDMTSFNAHLSEINTFGGAGLEILSAKQLWSFWLVAVMYVVGGIDYFVNIHQNRSRTRISYYVVCFQGLFLLVYLWSEPEQYMNLFPLCMINTSMLWGRLCSFSKGRIYDVIWSGVAIAWFITTLFIY